MVVVREGIGFLFRKIGNSKVPVAVRVMQVGSEDVIDRMGMDQVVIHNPIKTKLRSLRLRVQNREVVRVSVPARMATRVEDGSTRV